ncbi:MAG: 4-hydroxy-tetrahydrodipicolinate synthase [Clostridiales bacterium]|nr:MAG: 4-hydroxy-tetrahydrodipicolinate synthase [Clostridiales bacterium]
MKRTVFTDAATALITPMKNGGIDYEKFSEVVEFQIAHKIDALVVCGTTGESSTLTDAEHRDLIKFCVEKVAGRVPVIAGTGSNDTDYAIDLSKFACEVGVDALLQVTPYYNKTTQRGLIKHFFAVADAVNKPIILYNVPSRTGVNIKPETYAELCKHENIAATKEASGNLSAVAETRYLCGDSLDVYSGNDDQIIPIMSLGGKGVISVLSNILPAETHKICADFLNGDIKSASDSQINYIPLINSLFCEVNPIPVKTAMNLLGFCSKEIRLPLCEMEDSNKSRLIKDMKAVGLNF